MAYILSTLSNDVVYSLYKKTNSGINVAQKQIKVVGGSNVIDKNLQTPQGVVTKVTDDELEVLQNNSVFKKHVKNGFIKIQKSDKTDPKDLEPKDDSAQLVDKDFEDKGQKAPVTKEKNK